MTEESTLWMIKYILESENYRNDSQRLAAIWSAVEPHSKKYRRFTDAEGRVCVEILSQEINS